MKKILIGTVALLVAVAAAGTALAANAGAGDERRQARNLEPSNVIPTSDRSDPEELRAGGVTPREYLFAVQSAASCVQDVLQKDNEITGVRVEIPTGLSADQYQAGYTVAFTTTAHGTGRILGPADYEMVESADLDCQAKHIGPLEKEYQERLRATNGDQAVAALLACIGADAENAQDRESAREKVSRKVDAGLGTECLADAPLAAAVLAEGL